MFDDLNSKPNGVLLITCRPVIIIIIIIRIVIIVVDVDVVVVFSGSTIYCIIFIHSNNLP